MSGSTSFANTMLQNVIPSYLYTQYADDDDLQAFVASYNAIAQQYVNTFNQLDLPIYSSNSISGALLDWVGAGIYGYPRPSLPGTPATSIGPLNTYGYNAKVPLNTETSTTGTSFVVSDDIYARLLTWHFYKGDGKTFSIRWLKRRVLRFLIGTNGTAPALNYPGPIGSPANLQTLTSQISVTFSGSTATITCPNYPAAPYLQAAIASGAAEMPFQIYTWSLVISGSVQTTVSWTNSTSNVVTWINNASAAVTWYHS